MRERSYQASLIERLNRLFPGCLILKNDPSYIQGVPDLVILYNDRWAALEVKRSADSPVRPNQKHWVGVMSYMSFAAFIDPDNEEEVLDALQHSFTSRRPTRSSKRQQVSLD